MFDRFLAWLNALPDGTRDLVVGGILALATAAAGGLGTFALKGIAVRVRGVPLSPEAWRALEARFDQINDGEVEGMRDTFTTGAVTWSLHAARPDDWRQKEETGAEGRRVQRFQSEAKSAARLWKRQHPDTKTASDLVDAWLDLIAANVHRGSSISGNGYDARGTHDSLHFDRLVEASKVLCASFASDVEDAIA